MIFKYFFKWFQIRIDKVLQRKPSVVSFYVFEEEEREKSSSKLSAIFNLKTPMLGVFSEIRFS
jgi:hypothetical protein